MSESLFNKMAGLRPTTLSKNRLRQKCFPVNFAKFLRTPFLKSTSGRLLLIDLRRLMEIQGIQNFVITAALPQYICTRRESIKKVILTTHSIEPMITSLIITFLFL